MDPEATPTPVSAPQSDAPAAPQNTISSDALAEAIQKAREQEKNKLYPEMQRLKDALAEREAKISEWEKAQADASDAEKRREEAEMGFHELLMKKEEEFNQRITEEAKSREEAFALLEREREYQSLQAHRLNRVAEEEQNIIPELRDLVTGNSVEEIEASIAAIKDRSASIMNSVLTAQQQARQGMAGARVSNPAAGPLDTDPDNKTNFSDADVRQMSMADYAKNRTRLLGGAGNNRGMGIFG